MIPNPTGSSTYVFSLSLPFDECVDVGAFLIIESASADDNDSLAAKAAASGDVIEMHMTVLVTIVG
eukprot:scaffold1675_cov146-Skeletonema_menzelii.AAC.16